jgi:DNA topoisomerase-1
MKLMIIESPGKVAKLSAILGDDWKIAASVGHVRDLPQPVKWASLRPTSSRSYEMTDRGADVVAKLKGYVKQADVPSIWPPTRTGRVKASAGTCSNA